MEFCACMLTIFVYTKCQISLHHCPGKKTSHPRGGSSTKNLFQHCSQTSWGQTNSSMTMLLHKFSDCDKPCNSAHACCIADSYPFNTQIQNKILWLYNIFCIDFTFLKMAAMFHTLWLEPENVDEGLETTQTTRGVACNDWCVTSP